jgi:predicted nucleic acid-binding protein
MAEDEKLVTPEVVTADFCFLRLRKKRYSRKAVAERVRRLAVSGDVFVYFKHEETATGALRAEAVLRLLRKK